MTGTSILMELKSLKASCILLIFTDIALEKNYNQHTKKIHVKGSMTEFK